MAAAAAEAKNPGGGPAAASHCRRHLSNRLRKPLKEWGLRGRARADGGACRGPQSMRKPSANRSSGADTGAGALGRKALDQGSALPSSPQSKQNKGGSARQRAPEEASTSGAGG